MGLSVEAKRRSRYRSPACPFKFMPMRSEADLIGVALADGTGVANNYFKKLILALINPIPTSFWAFHLPEGRIFFLFESIYVPSYQT